MIKSDTFYPLVVHHLCGVSNIEKMLWFTGQRRVKVEHYLWFSCDPNPCETSSGNPCYLIELLATLHVLWDMTFWVFLFFQIYCRRRPAVECHVMCAFASFSRSHNCLSCHPVYDFTPTVGPTHKIGFEFLGYIARRGSVFFSSFFAFGLYSIFNVGYESSINNVLIDCQLKGNRTKHLMG